MAYNIDLTAALKASKPDTRSKTAEFPDKTAERPNSFKDSLNEVVRSRSLNERQTDASSSARKELVSRSESKLKSIKKPEVKAKESEKPEVDENEKQTDKVVKTMDELLAKLEELAKLQTNGVMPVEKQAGLLEDIKAGLKELISAQSGRKGIETTELQAKTIELTTKLQGILEELKNSGNFPNKVEIEDFAQQLNAIIGKNAELETASKPPAENNAKEQVLMKEVSSANEAVISYKEASVKTDNANETQGQEKKTDFTAVNKPANEQAEVQKQEMKTEVPIADIKPVNPKAQPEVKDATEEVKTALDSKVEKVMVEGKESKKQSEEGETQKDTPHEVPKTVVTAQPKPGNEEIAAMKLNQTSVDNKVEAVQNQVPVTKSEPINKAEVINQIVKKAELIFTDAKQEIKMQLEPENLGKLTLKLAVEKGLITAKFEAESYEVKQVIESSFNQLKDMLQEKGLEVQNCSVYVRQDNKENNNGSAFQQWKETVKLNGRSINNGSYEGYQIDGVAPVRTANPYSVHSGIFDHRA